MVGEVAGPEEAESQLEEGAQGSSRTSAVASFTKTKNGIADAAEKQVTESQLASCCSCSYQVPSLELSARPPADPKTEGSLSFEITPATKTETQKEPA